MSGILGLYLSQYPRATAEQARQALRISDRKIGNLPYDNNGRNDVYGYGLVDATRLLQINPEAASASAKGCVLLQMHRAGYLTQDNLKHLRGLRDWMQTQGTLGKRLVRSYYAFSAWWLR